MTSVPGLTLDDFTLNEDTLRTKRSLFRGAVPKTIGIFDRSQGTAIQYFNLERIETDGDAVSHWVFASNNGFQLIVDDE